jgi:hypothetical protein
VRNLTPALARYGITAEDIAAILVDVNRDRG